MIFFNLWFAWVYAVQISAKKLIQRGRYKHFGKSIAGGENFAFTMTFPSLCYALLYAVQITSLS